MYGGHFCLRFVPVSFHCLTLQFETMIFFWFVTFACCCTLEQKLLHSLILLHPVYLACRYQLHKHILHNKRFNHRHSQQNQIIYMIWLNNFICITSVSKHYLYVNLLFTILLKNYIEIDYTYELVYLSQISLVMDIWNGNKKILKQIFINILLLLPLNLHAPRFPNNQKSRRRTRS
jgi:hypothetical protein